MVNLPYTSEAQSTRGKFGQEFEAGTKIKPQRSRGVAAYWLSLSASLTQDHLFTGGIAHSGLEYPTSIIHQDDAPIRLTYGLIGQSDGGGLSTEVPSS